MRNEDSRDEQRCSSARLLNLHIVIYSTTHGRPPPITIVLSHTPLKRTSHFVVTLGVSLDDKFIVERARPGVGFRASSRILNVLSVSRRVSRGERATIISRQSPRKSSRRTSTAPPLCANFSYGQKASGLATNKRSHGRYRARAYTHVSRHARTAMHVHFHSYTHTRAAARLDLDSSANVAYAREGYSRSNSVSPPNAARCVVALDGEADGVPEPG